MIALEEAARLANLIADSTGTGWTDDQIKLLTEYICKWNDPGAAYATADRIARTWVKEWRPSFGVIFGAYDEEAAKSAKAEAHVRAEEKPQCDGTGWNDSVPCKRCNPYLRDIYEDKPRWEKWRLDGTSLADLHDGVAIVDKKMAGTTGMPPPCKPIPDRTLTPAEAYWAARKGYEAECLDAGREPNPVYFDKMMLGLLTHAESDAEAPVEPVEVYIETPWPEDADEPIEGIQHDPAPSTRLADAIAETRRRLAEDDD